MKSHRESTMQSLHELLRDQMWELLYEKSVFSCTLSDKQALCDTLNLGCLLQAFPFLCDPERVDDAKNCTIAATVDQIEHVTTYGSELTFHQWNRRNNTGDHTACDIEKVLLTKAESIVHSVQGLVLPACCLPSSSRPY